jgi:hypothetical protein
LNRVGLSFGAFRSLLSFGRGTQAVPVEEAAVGLSYERRMSPKLTLQVNAGGIVGGTIALASNPVEPGSPEHLAGGFVGGGLSFTALEQAGAIPFVMLGAALSSSLVRLPFQRNLFAADLRASVTAGYTLGGRWTPYLVARAFGGPVVDVSAGAVGGDLYHYQFGAGLVVGLPGGLDLSAEIVPLGEQRLSAGVGFSF